jgi:hypothetical protein
MKDYSKWSAEIFLDESSLLGEDTDDVDVDTSMATFDNLFCDALTKEFPGMDFDISWNASYEF